jgi:hypothetical protein
MASVVASNHIWRVAVETSQRIDLRQARNTHSIPPRRGQSQLLVLNMSTVQRFPLYSCYRVPATGIAIWKGNMPFWYSLEGRQVANDKIIVIYRYNSSELFHC